MVNRSSLSIYQFIATFVLPSCILYHLQSSTHIFCNALATNNNNNKSKTYNYFAFGSNMYTSTMINLRGIKPISSTAAVLPKHTLRFNIPGVPLIEPSSASVEPMNDMSGEVVHGVLYKLSEEDFATVCSTEGVPFAYSLHRCRVIPYLGDGRNAGQTAMQKTLGKDSDTDTSNNNGEQSTDTSNYEVSAFTLRAARKEWQQRRKDIPPSQAYLNVLLRGAREFSLDEESYHPPWNPSPKINSNGFLNDYYSRCPGEWEILANIRGKHGPRNHNRYMKLLNIPVACRQVPGDGNCLFHSIASCLYYAEYNNHLPMNSFECINTLRSKSLALRNAAVDILQNVQNNGHRRLFLQGEEYLEAQELLSAVSKGRVFLIMDCRLPTSNTHVHSFNHLL